MEAIIKRIL